ncbi:MAG: lysophospholipid acyltransferase family protein [Planctomycetota bacterium]|jgi:lysophospholipid acyltransferase (LPLAT)-like uncharacterized protein
MGDPVTLRLAESLGPALIRGLGATLRFTVRPEGALERWRRDGRRVIFAFWHGRMLLAAFYGRFRRIAILISRHRDGEYIARVAGRLGFVPVRGSTTRGGLQALRGALRRAGAGHDLAFTPDGPRGPRYRVQAGVIYAASRTGLPIVPVGVEASPAWVLSSWDQFTIPKPFGRAAIVFGEPIEVPPDISGEAIEARRLALEEEMHRLMEGARGVVEETRRGPVR